jgi:hypothetical protein
MVGDLLLTGFHCKTAETQRSQRFFSQIQSEALPGGLSASAVIARILSQLPGATVDGDIIWRLRLASSEKPKLTVRRAICG